MYFTREIMNRIALNLLGRALLWILGIILVVVAIICLK